MEEAYRKETGRSAKGEPKEKLWVPGAAETAGQSHDASKTIRGGIVAIGVPHGSVPTRWTTFRRQRATRGRIPCACAAEPVRSGR